MLQIKVIDCNNIIVGGITWFHKYLLKIKTLNQAYDLYKTNKYSVYCYYKNVWKILNWESL